MLDFGPHYRDTECDYHDEAGGEAKQKKGNAAGGSEKVNWCPAGSLGQVNGFTFKCFPVTGGLQIESLIGVPSGQHTTY